MPKAIRIALALLALTTTLSARAQGESGTFLLDSYDVEVFGAPDSARVAAGLSFGTVYSNGWWWNAGPRISWVRWNVDMPRQDGLGLGGMFGGGWHPEKTVSPYAALSLERVLNVNDRFDWATTVSVGARVRVTPNPREYFSMTFALYQGSVFGGDGPNGSDYGIAVFYSASLFAKKK